jgi:flagellar biogenesis protein FliO
MVEAKFRKLQKEMEGGNSGRSIVNPGNESTTPTSKNLQAPEPRSAASLAFQILVGLVFVLLLAVVTIRLLKRLQGRMLAKPGKTGGNFFEVLETCHLGTNQRVVALRINEEVGVLGVTPQGISLLTMLKEPASEVRQAYARESNAVAFSDNLNKLLDRFKKPKRVSDLLDEVQG